MDLKLTNKVVFISGAAGGIGRALADAFAAENARLVLHAHQSYEALRAHAGRRWSPERVFAVQADVSRPAEVDAAMEQGVAHFGRVDVCVVNAGIWPPEHETLAEISLERLRTTLEVNLFGAIWTCRAFLNALRRTGPRLGGEGASITLIGSTAGRFGERGHADYSISKAGLYGLVRSLKNEIVTLDPRGRINMVEPGWTVTPMAAQTLAEPGAITAALRTTALRQLASPEDIARAVLFLSSPDAARHITGEVLTVAGGMEGRVLWDPADIDERAIQRGLN
jgi:3-oxoacyl-[acyl-carrier protein] reductase